MRTWLEVHVFCGVIGPVFITFHTSFKFGGIVSVAYWSMIAVVSSGFMGRYLYNHIPHTLRGLEVGRADLERRAADAEALSAMGELALNLAHEVRNPLGAISHAGQLLAESTQLPDDDRRLVQIIAEHSARMNDIIRNVLQIGRRDSAVMERVALVPWLQAFADELAALAEPAREELVDAILAALSLDAWTVLRRRDKLSLDRAIAAWKLTLSALLTQARTR